MRLMTIGFSCFLLLSGCKFNTASEVQKSASQTQWQKRKGTNGIDFNIPFLDVDENIAKEFWKGGFAVNSVNRQLNKDKSSNGIIIQEAVQKYFKVASDWMLMDCVEIDMAKASEKKVVVTRTRKLASTHCYLRGDLDWSKPGIKFSPQSKKRIHINERYYKRDDLWENRIKTAEEVLNFIGVEYEVAQGTKSFPVLGAMFFAVNGDFLVPTASYSHSKAFATPVMRFRCDGKPCAKFYDFGELVLYGLDAEDDIYLLSGQDSGVKNLIQQKKTNLIGTQFKRLPEGLNKWIETGDESTDELNFGRVPVGSFHFSINSIYNEYFDHEKKAVLMYTSVKRSELLDLYYNGGAWINSYDRKEDPISYESNDKNVELIQQAIAGCGETKSVTSLTPHELLNNEIVIGGERGRALLEKKGLRIKEYTCH